MKSTYLTSFCLAFGMIPWPLGAAVSVSVTELSELPYVGKTSPAAYESVANRLYFLGGYTPSPKGYIDRIRVFDLDSLGWSELPFTMRYPISDANRAIFIGGHFYVTPGFTTGEYNGWGSHNKLIDVDLANAIARETAAFHFSTLWDLLTCKANDMVYIFGGHNGSDHTDIYEYSPAAASLSRVANMRYAHRTGSATLGADGWIYIMGWSAPIERFHPATRAVETLSASLPSGPSGVRQAGVVWHMALERAIYFTASGEWTPVTNPVVYRLDYAHDVLTLTGAHVPGAVSANAQYDACIRDSADPTVAYVLMEGADGNEPKRLCRATLVFEGTPIIVTPPQSLTCDIGSTATFTVVAGGDAPLACRWLFNGARTLTDNERISGTESPTLSITNLVPSDAGLYSVVLSNSSGTIVSDAAALALIGPGPQTVNLADFSYPLVVGNEWVYDHTAKPGDPPNRLFRVDSVSSPLICYTDRLSPKSYVTNVVVVYEAFYTFTTLGAVDPNTAGFDMWLQYRGPDGGLQLWGFDDDPGTTPGSDDEHVRIDGGLLFPHVVTIGQPVTLIRDMYEDGVYVGPITGMVNVLAQGAVTVPAGEFSDCILVLHQYSMGNKSHEDAEWWAKGVGVVQRTRTTSGDEPERDDLRIYRISSPPAIHLACDFVNGSPRITATGDEGTCARLESTADVSDWSAALPVMTNRVPFSFFVTVPANEPQRYYRGIVCEAQDPATLTNRVLIPAGSFQMGDALNEGNADEFPVHAVHVSAFQMDQFEVSKALWDTVRTWANTNGYDLGSVGNGPAPYHPVNMVNWYDAVKWCNARSERERLIPAYYTDEDQGIVYREGELVVQPSWVKWNAGYRLPTEAEWEKAARGGVDGHRFPWSDTDTITHGRANYYSVTNYVYDISPTRGYHPDFEFDGTHYPSPIGYFAPNGYGLYDMAGNAWEWCGDCYGPYDSAPAFDPRGSTRGTARVFRGGGWHDHAVRSRVAFRYGGASSSGRWNDIGFRTVLPAE